MAARLCLGCDEVIAAGTRCPRCTVRASPRQRQAAGRARAAHRGGTAQRGYGAAHQRAAAALKAALVDGQPCARCGGPLYRAQLQLDRNHPDGIDAGHADGRPASEGHPPEQLEHRRCNQSAAGFSRSTNRRTSS